MSSLQISADLGFLNQKFHISLSLLEFKEDNVTIIYAPALDLSGYDYSQDEARSSFLETLRAFFRYTHNKKTLNTILKDLGWSISGLKNNLKFSPPKDSDLVATNTLYNDIVNTKNYKVIREELEFAL